MAGRGRKPTPTKLLALRGSQRAKYRAPEIAPLPASLEAPDWLSDKAKVHWNTLGPQLHRYGLLTVLDTMAFGMLCTMLHHCLAMQAEIDKTDLLMDDARGSEKAHPLFRVSLAYETSLLKIMCEFGMTPRARVGLPVSQALQDDPLDTFLDQKGKKKALLATPKDKSRFFRMDKRD